MTAWLTWDSANDMCDHRVSAAFARLTGACREEDADVVREAATDLRDAADLLAAFAARRPASTRW